MKSLLGITAAALLLTTSVWAHEAEHEHAKHAHDHAAQASSKLDPHALEDIERHRGMARAHEQAAQCLEQGKNYDECQKQLQASCKGLALGKNCGMRHSH